MEIKQENNNLGNKGTFFFVPKGENPRPLPPENRNIKIYNNGFGGDSSGFYFNNNEYKPYKTLLAILRENPQWIVLIIGISYVIFIKSLFWL